ALPRSQEEIPYHAVSAGKKDFRSEGDQKGALHFMEFEKRGARGALPNSVYESIAFEISKIKGKSIAILVSSSAQGESVANTLKRWNIPSFSQKTPLLGESPAVKAFQELLRAIAAPRQLSALKIALGGILIGWNSARVGELNTAAVLEKTLLQFYQ